MPTLPSGPLSFSQIQGEFGGSNPISLSEYYRTGLYVPDIPQAATIPTGGTISVTSFFGTSGYFYFNSTITNYTGTYSLYSALVSAGWNQSSPVQVNLTVTGTVVGSSIYGYAMTIERMPVNSTVNLHNYGVISGKPGESSFAFNSWQAINGQLLASTVPGSPAFAYINSAGQYVGSPYPEGLYRTLTAQHGGRALLIQNPVTNIYNYSGAWIAGGGGAGGNGQGIYNSSHNYATITNDCGSLSSHMPGGSGWDAITCSVVGQLNDRWPYVYNYAGGNIAGGGGGGGGGIRFAYNALACGFATVTAAGGGGGGGQTITGSSGAGIPGCYTYCGGVDSYGAGYGSGGSAGGAGAGGAGGGVNQGIYNATYFLGGAGGNGGSFGADGGYGGPSNGAFTPGTSTYPTQGGYGGRARRVYDGDIILQVNSGTIYGSW